MVRVSPAVLAVAVGWLALTASNDSEAATEPQPISLPPLEVVDKSLFSLFDKFTSYFNMVRPDSSFPEKSEHRQQALTDHTNDEIFDSTSQEIIERSGFKQETHYTTTRDGYITELINVINPLADRSQLKHPPVMLFHGAIVETSTYLWASAIQHHPEKYPRTASDGPITSSNRSLGLMLANYGYDVWLVATRGSNARNIGHTTLKTKLFEDILANPLDPLAPVEIVDTLKYYEFSQDELVEIEFPAQIERVLELTNSTKVSTITYSISTHVMYKLLAENNEISKKVYTNVALAPLLNRNGSSSLLYGIEDFSLDVPDPVGNFFLQLLLTRATRELLRKLDRYTAAYYLIGLAVGPNPRYQTFLEDPVIGHILKPVAFGELKQYSQQVIKGQLQKYDRGVVKNLELYGQATPPVYNISNIQIERWMLVAGDTDILGTLDSAEQYVKLIPHPPYKYLKFTGGWNHFDSAAAFEVDTKVNLPILDFFDHFSSADANKIAQTDN